MIKTLTDVLSRNNFVFNHLGLEKKSFKKGFMARKKKIN